MIFKDNRIENWILKAESNTEEKKEIMKPN
jgi:hypothetical protein